MSMAMTRAPVCASARSAGRAAADVEHRGVAAGSRPAMQPVRGIERRGLLRAVRNELSVGELVEPVEFALAKLFGLASRSCGCSAIHDVAPAAHPCVALASREPVVSRTPPPRPTDTGELVELVEFAWRKLSWGCGHWLFHLCHVVCRSAPGATALH